VHKQVRIELALSSKTTDAPDLTLGHLVGDLGSRQGEHLRE
jgi:hypothetical protein